MEVKIKGFVIALPPLESPSHLLRWYIEWKMAQVLVPALLRQEEATRRLTDAVEGFIQAAKDAGMEEEDG